MSKTANVTARIEPQIKEQAEAVLEQIGIPVSVLIDTLYRQIIITGGIPYSLTIPKVQSMDSLSKEQFGAVLKTGYDEAEAGEGLSVAESFEKIRGEI